MTPAPSPRSKRVHLFGTLTVLFPLLTGSLFDSQNMFIFQNGALFQKNYFSEDARLLLFVPHQFRRRYSRRYMTIEQPVIRAFLKHAKEFGGDDFGRSCACPSINTKCFVRHASAENTQLLLHLVTLSSAHAFECLGIGLFGSLPLSTRNNRYVAVAIVHLGRYAVTTLY